MPHISVSMFPGRDEKTKRELANKLQDFVVKEMNIDRKFVSVSIKDVKKEDWTEHVSHISKEERYTDIFIDY